MTDRALAKKWLKSVNADSIIEDKKRQEKIALSLLRGWRRYQETGLSPWTQEPLCDYTYFLHAFAQRHGGSDDELYQWLSVQGVKMLEILDGAEGGKHCRFCGRVMTSGNNNINKALCSVCKGKN